MSSTGSSRTAQGKPTDPLRASRVRPVRAGDTSNLVALRINTVFGLRWCEPFKNSPNLCTDTAALANITSRDSEVCETLHGAAVSVHGLHPTGALRTPTNTPPPPPPPRFLLRGRMAGLSPTRRGCQLILVAVISQ